MTFSLFWRLPKGKRECDQTNAYIFQIYQTILIITVITIITKILIIAMILIFAAQCSGAETAKVHICRSGGFYFIWLGNICQPFKSSFSSSLSISSSSSRALWRLGTKGWAINIVNAMLFRKHWWNIALISKKFDVAKFEVVKQKDRCFTRAKEVGMYSKMVLSKTLLKYIVSTMFSF